jgi:hypothetical protein
MASTVMRHGTHSAYSGGCRCDPCRVAHRVYERNQQRKRAYISYGFEQPVQRFVKAAEVTKHLRFLQQNGMGLEAVSKASGVAVSTLQPLRMGKKKRVLVMTHKKIMAVSLVARSEGQFIDSSKSKALLQELIDLGFKKTELGRALGDPWGHIYLRKKIRVSRAKRIENLHKLFVKKIDGVTYVTGKLK